MKRILAKVSLAGVSMLLGLLLLELGYRVILFGLAGLSIAKVNSVNSLGRSGLLQPSAHSEIVYELEPNLSTYFKLARFETNSWGLRDAQYSITKPDRTFRVAVIGDSFTLPAGVEIEDAFHSVLERRLNRESGGLSYEFINFAVGGYDLRQYLGVIEHRALAYQPDLILIGFCPANDHEITPERRFSRAYRVKPRTHPFLSHSFVLERVRSGLEAYQKQRAKQRKREKARQHRARRPAAPGSTRRQRPAHTEEEAAYMSEHFSRLAEIQSHEETPVVVVYLSHRTGVGRSRAAFELAEILERAELRFLDTTPAFEGTDVRDFMIYAIDRHPNMKAHRIFADRIHAYLRAEVLLPAPRP